MNIEEIRTYCIAKPFATEGFPFDETTLVFKVHGKMFALLNLDAPHSINLKCEPDRAIQLREQYTEIIPGYHMNKQMWNTVDLNGFLSDSFICELIDQSYELIWNGLPKKLREPNPVSN